MQLIVFYDETKFLDMVLSYAVESFKTMFYNDGRRFNQGSRNNNKVIVVDRVGIPTIIYFEQASVQNASIILIPDPYSLNYSPTQPFMVLKHSGEYSTTLIGNPIEVIIHSENKNKNHQLKEESLYYKVLKFIANIEKLTFEQLIEEYVPNENIVKIDRTINYLHDCLNQKDIIESEEFNSEKGKSLDKFSEIRDNLLSQCTFEPEKE